MRTLVLALQAFSWLLATLYMVSNVIDPTP